MGQRHMTYVVVEVGDDKAVACLYNQWNHENIQPQKVIRFLKALKKWENKIAKEVEARDVCKLYEFAASVHNGGMSHFHLENELYSPRYGMYEEDNNNGWQIVYIRRPKGAVKFEVVVGFKPGEEWAKDFAEYGYLPLFMYLRRCIPRYDMTLEEFINGFSESDKKLLDRINNGFNAEDIAWAERLTAIEIKKLQNAKAKKAA